MTSSRTRTGSAFEFRDGELKRIAAAAGSKTTTDILQLCSINAASDVNLKMTAKIPLPDPPLESESSLEDSLRARRSVRDFAAEPVSLLAVGQLLWAAQGATSLDGKRTVPSAGALYPLEVYLAAGEVDSLVAGVYRYAAAKHELRLHAPGDRRGILVKAALGQPWIGSAPAVLVIAAVYRRTAAQYGSRANRYVHMEVGHAAQNVYLQTQSLALGTVMVGAFEDDRVRDVLELPAKQAPLALMPVGKPSARKPNADDITL